MGMLLTNGVFDRFAMDERAGGSIHGYIGANGAGKSLVCALDTMQDLDDGVPVLSTMRFLDWRNPRPCEDAECLFPEEHAKGHQAAHPCWVPWQSWDDFMAFSWGIAVADEINGVAASADHSNLPKRVAKKLHEMRRGEIIYRWTAPAWARADLRIREVTTMVTVCVGMRKHAAADGRRRYRQAHLVKAVTYNVEEITDFNVQSRQNFDEVGKQFLHVLKTPARLVYDTFAPVLMVGRGSEVGGRCDVCGKRTREEYCKGHPELEAGEGPAEHELASAQPGSAGSGSGGAAVLALVDHDHEHGSPTAVPVVELPKPRRAIDGGRR